MLDGRDDLDLLGRVVSSADELLRAMDAEGIARAALINSVAPDVIGITDLVNPWIARYVEGHRDRLVPVGGIHPRHSRDVAADMKKLLDVYRLGAIKLHPPHMEMAANAYRTDCPSLADVYRLAGEAKRPVLIHTGTSIFPGARNVYADPMACDDVAVDFPGTTLVLCHAGRPLWYETAFFLVEAASERPARHLEHPAEESSSRSSRGSPRSPIASCGEPTGRRREYARCAGTSRTFSLSRFRTRCGGRSSSTTPRRSFPPDGIIPPCPLNFFHLVPDSRHETGLIRNPRAARRGRDGRSLQGERHATRESGRAEGPAGRFLRRQGKHHAIRA